MISVAFLEKRREHRKTLTGLLPGKLQVVGKGNYISCRPIDITAKGLGIITSDLIEIGERLILKTHNDSIILRVVWSKADFGKQSLYRYGLEVENPKIDIQDIFIQTGCLK